MSPILVTLTSCCDSNFESSNVSLNENKSTGVNPNSNGIDYCVRKNGGKILWFSANCISFIQLAAKLMPCFWSIITDLQNEVTVQTLIFPPNINQIKRFMNQNLSWLIVNPKQFQFRKPKILFSCYAPFNSEPLLTRPVVLVILTFRLLEGGGGGLSGPCPRK